MAGNDRAIKEVRNWREFEEELFKLGEEIRNTIELESNLATPTST